LQMVSISCDQVAKRDWPTTTLKIRKIYYEDRVLHINYVFTCNCGSHLRKIGKTGQGFMDALCTVIKDSNFQKLISIIQILQGKQLHVTHQIRKKKGHARRRAPNRCAQIGRTASVDQPSYNFYSFAFS
jgi:hypothetical protein